MGLKLSRILNEWLADFIRDLDRRNYSPRSLRSYRYDLLLFTRWVGEQAQLKAPGDLVPAVLEEYQMHLMLRAPLRNLHAQPRPLSAAVRNRHLAELRTFFRFLKKTCKLLSNPAVELERVREPKRLPKAVLSVPEMARLLGAIDTETASGLRDRAALELLYGVGLRRFELLGIDLAHLRLAEELLYVMGKGGKERILPLGRAATRAIERYLQMGRPLLLRENSQALLISGYHGGRLSGTELILALRKCVKQVGIKKYVSFHLFRHTCATHLLRGGADLRAIQTLLGHSKLDTTAIYTRVEISDLHNTLRRCHPRETDPDAPPTPGPEIS